MAAESRRRGCFSQASKAVLPRKPPWEPALELFFSGFQCGASTQADGGNEPTLGLG